MRIAGRGAKRYAAARRDLGVLLPERGEVVEDPEGAPLGGRDQVAVAHLEVGDRHGGDPLEGVPARAVVHREPGAGLSARVEQSAPLGILAHHAHGLAGAQAVDEPSPGAAVVGGAIDVRRRVADAIPTERDIHRRGVVRRDLDLVHEAIAGAGRRDVRPGRAAVARELQVAVVRADVERARVVPRLVDRDDGAVDLAARAFIGDRSAAPSLPRAVVLREVAGDRAPARAAVGRAEEHVAARGRSRSRRAARRGSARSS